MKNNVLKLIRNMVVSWDITEIGAPTIDPHIPYGSTDMVQDIIRITGVKDSSSAIELHEQTKIALEKFIEQAQLEPGQYTLTNALKDKDLWVTENVLENIYPQDANQETITFHLKEEHLKLLRVSNVEWAEWDDREDDDELFPTPGINPDKPYGESTDHIQDIAELFGKSYDDLTDREYDALEILHQEMQIALQVFLKNANLFSGKGQQTFTN